MGSSQHPLQSYILCGSSSCGLAVVPPSSQECLQLGCSCTELVFRQVRIGTFPLSLWLLISILPPKALLKHGTFFARSQGLHRQTWLTMLPSHKRGAVLAFLLSSPGKHLRRRHVLSLGQPGTEFPWHHCICKKWFVFPASVKVSSGFPRGDHLSR